MRGDLPKLVTVDDGSKFKDMIIKMCNAVMIKYHTMTKENHKAFASEWFHSDL